MTKKIDLDCESTCKLLSSTTKIPVHYSVKQLKQIAAVSYLGECFHSHGVCGNNRRSLKERYAENTGKTVIAFLSKLSNNDNTHKEENA